MGEGKGGGAPQPSGHLDGAGGGALTEYTSERESGRGSVSWGFLGAPMGLHVEFSSQRYAGHLLLPGGDTGASRESGCGADCRPRDKSCGESSSSFSPNSLPGPHSTLGSVCTHRS